MSGDEISTIWQRFKLRLQPRLQGLAATAPGRFDLAARLVDLADATEAGFARILRPVRRALRSGAIGLTGGLVWRGLAALTGVSLTAMLVAGLSSGSSEPALASLTLTEASAAPVVRDVRTQALPIASGQEGWVTIGRPIALFGVESPELDKRSAYEARRSEDGQRREDVLTFGAFDDGKSFLSLKFQVNRDAQAQKALAGVSQPFVIGLVRESAARGLSVGRSGAATTIETKFGTVETADIGLSDGAAGRACIAFRHLDAAAHLSFSGWWCGSEAKPADRAQLICLIDRIDLLSAGDDPELRANFARTELNRRQGCSVPRLAATGRKGSWLDADAKAPALRPTSGKQAQAR
ncbi:hypothetical protein ASE66_14995 [Bosea sp. Root483D1]|uniref:hypothetical protein n=1 Tax=Bosea sp. Root483D1 TaxID=1736544 RepID=UPI000708982A|nr:hypothetical protein [Bosea sp. Root483D1]KRE14656.1 hypothetical protein ASE66_14995 [Bosea sp. Root483D1]